ncbi:MAG: PTS fructose transporter subunit IIA [Pseudomonadota bacterium]
MSVALLLITHTPFGSATLEATIGTLGTLPLETRVMDIQPDCDLEQERNRARELLNELDQGDGVLILTDLYGATPSNIACSLMGEEHPLILISGLSLAMLIRVMNYAEDGLQALAEKALNGGRDSIYMHPPLAQQERVDHA